MKFVLRHLVCPINCYSSLVIYFGVLDCLNTIFLQTRNGLTDAQTDRPTYKASCEDASKIWPFCKFDKRTDWSAGSAL